MTYLTPVQRRLQQLLGKQTKGKQEIMVEGFPKVSNSATTDHAEALQNDKSNYIQDCETAADMQHV